MEDEFEKVMEGCRGWTSDRTRMNDRECKDAEINQPEITVVQFDFLSVFALSTSCDEDWRPFLTGDGGGLDPMFLPTPVVHRPMIPFQTSSRDQPLRFHPHTFRETLHSMPVV